MAGELGTSTVYSKLWRWLESVQLAVVTPGELGYLYLGCGDGLIAGLPVKLTVAMAGELGYQHSWLW
jgi:hypothetical protein